MTVLINHCVPLVHTAVSCKCKQEEGGIMSTGYKL
jgi:hypothetical protein